ncbi:glycosyltransferase family 4 protein [Streptomyces sp. NPDC007856]|uniref:glycosyltransferase family 4 protein n=1 Tax=Streptomyces sp. NPDC007856 TaxID=3364781 RepID=UPI0036AC01A4
MTISDQVWGGKHRYMFDTVLGLHRAGHTVITMAERNSPMLAAVRAAGLPTVTAPVFADSREEAAAVLESTLRAEGVDIVCVSGRHDSAAWLQVDADLADGPALVLYRHSAFPLPDAPDTDRLLERTDLVIATSREQADAQFGGRAARVAGLTERVEVITSGVGTEFLERTAAADRSAMRRRLGLDAEDFVFAVVARLSWEKNIEQAIEAFAKAALTEGEASASLLVVGDGPMLDELRRLSRERGVADQIHFLGHREDVPEILAAVDAVMLTSSVPETGPLALKEAMAAGRPVIAAAVGGIPEFVEDEVSGLLVKDTDQLIRAMQRLILDEAFAAELGRQGREAILTGHLLERRIEFLVWRLDLMAITAGPLRTVLDEIEWDDIRLRAEAEGGFVFVPRTSQILPVDGPAYESVQCAVAAGDPRLLITDDEAESRKFIGTLFRMGALVRRGRFSERDR